MIKGIYTAASGMVPRALQQELIANNMANSATAGFKRDRLFIEHLDRSSAKPLPSDYQWQQPMVEEPYIDFSQGMLEKTDKPLDVALEGDGFFVIDTENGTRYTRNGQFHLNSIGMLVNMRGEVVLSDTGPIILENNNPNIDANGNIEIDGEAISRLQVVRFDNPQELTKTDGVHFAAPDGLIAEPAREVTVRQGFLEQSNVEILHQMVDMIDGFRQFELGQKVIQTLDYINNKAVNEVGRTR
ncbi:MAG: flagellar basal-body rod protein FlgF [candidate division Zixibacteria bacterium]|nr:flagellar basal-body rod protein FlgF [candidate division Zixibacteria bacterium]